MFDYIDIHSHLYFPDFDADREDEIQKLKDAKIATISIGVDFESSQKCIEFAEKHDNLFACVGQYPSDLTIDSVFDDRLTNLAQHPRVVAIGECGLDYFRMSPDDTELKDIQKKVFISHIELSLSTGKPLMLHIRPKDKIDFDAYKDTLDILESYAQIHGDRLRGNVHFFIGSMEILKRFLAIGFSVSFGGVLTFTHEYDECVRSIPPLQLMSETDAPLVAPVPYRGKRNSPLYVPYVVQKIAEIRGESLETVRMALRDNAVRHFGL